MGFLGKSSKFIELIQAIEAAARCDVRVLMEGESGTGIELDAEEYINKHCCCAAAEYYAKKAEEDAAKFLAKNE